MFIVIWRETIDSCDKQTLNVELEFETTTNYQKKFASNQYLQSCQQQKISFGKT